MISSTSLPAFSPVTAPSAATRVATQPSVESVTRQKPLQALPSGQAPTKLTPRGSLLDLSV